ncbi:C4-dicarboxylate ABC transporter substrate-binding protein [Breoghania sp. L-A4]|nr:C4-dicarboxylate ABC transporter substrate-binding protein [Breoghania sp. L-A4]
MIAGRLALPTAALMLLTATTASAETLKLAHFVSPAHVVTASVVDPLVKGVAADSNGTLEIKVYPGGELGAGPLEQYVRTLQGVADIAWGLSGYTSSQFPKSMIVEMPGAMPAGMTGYQMLWNAYEKHLTDEFPGTIPLAMWASEPNIFIMKDRVIHTPEDLKGLKMRVSGSVSGAMMTALGATPVQMPAGQIYNALQTGLIDGVVTGASAVNDFKLDEVANSYSIGASLGHIMFYLVMNEAKYNSLDDVQKAAIDKNSGIELSKLGEEGWNALAAETIARLREDESNTVVDLTAEEITAFRVIADQVRTDLIAAMDGAEILATMQGQ